MKRIVVLVCGLGAVVAWSGGIEVPSARASSATACPETLSVFQHGRSAPEPWETIDLDEDAMHRLSGAAIFSGPPGLLRELRPSDISGGSRPSGRTFRYEFSEGQRNGIYLVCRYDSTTVVAFTRILPDPKSCTFAYSHGQRGLAPIVVHCD